ncbi:hypothetical protein [Marivita sp.]|uniref:hypothetical protein n=1 Tax=Marivita sp. TaxID=2003365 RepID=UPI003F6A6A35
MILLLVILAFYTASLSLALAYTHAQQAIVQGIGIAALAAIAALTLWLLVYAGYIEPWLSVAMSGAIALPGFMIGLGLGFGGLLRVTGQKRDWKFWLTCLGAATPAVFGILTILAS